MLLILLRHRLLQYQVQIVEQEEMVGLETSGSSFQTHPESMLLGKFTGLTMTLRNKVGSRKETESFP